MTGSTNWGWVRQQGSTRPVKATGVVLSLPVTLSGEVEP